MTDDEFEIVPHKDILELKRAILKFKSGNVAVATQDLKSSIDELNNNLRLMIDLFSEANALMKEEEKDAQVLSSNVAPITNKLDTLLDQNQKVAKGLVTVAELVKKTTSEPARQPQEVQPKPMMPNRQPNVSPPIMPHQSTIQQPPLNQQAAPQPAPPQQATMRPNNNQISPPIQPNAQIKPDLSKPADLHMASTMPPLPKPKRIFNFKK